MLPHATRARPDARRQGGSALDASLSALNACLVALLAWGAIGIAGLVRPASTAFAGRALFLMGALCGLALAAAAAIGVTSAPEELELALGLPGSPCRLRLDALSGTFLVLLGVTSAGISIFSSGYFRKGDGASPGLLCLQFHVFLASMGVVLLAADAYAFMVAWESMALSSYFLVTTQHRLPEIRRAGFLYLLMAHGGALAILLSFSLLHAEGADWSFAAMRAVHLGPSAASGAFLLALLGFGAKAGLVPLHAWLPEAHPAAPSPVSALMSGIMLKTAVYGILRVSFDLLGTPVWWWGLVALACGLFSAFYGVIFAAVQTDMKRLLAWSSIENLGIVFAGVGLAVIFKGVGMEAPAALALIATLYHTLNHALMKSLLFLGTGSVLHATGERNLGHLGGLIHRMPWVAWLTLVGALAIAGLPPLNGFVSEWLLLQAFLFAGEVPHSFVNMLLPVAAAVVALCTALAGYVMVKFFGVVFLGQLREEALATARDAGVLERLGLAWLALGCCVLGLLPVQAIGGLDRVAAQLLHVPTGYWGAQWWLLAPGAARQASYGPLLFFTLVLLVIVIAALAVRVLHGGRLRFGPAWDGGFGRTDARMQDSAEGFGQPVRVVFEPFFLSTRELPSAFDAVPRYRMAVGDRALTFLYAPLGRWVRRTADVIARSQQGRIAAYLLYSFVTLIALLALVL